MLVLTGAGGPSLNNFVSLTNNYEKIAMEYWIKLSGIYETFLLVKPYIIGIHETELKDINNAWNPVSGTGG